MVSIDLFYPPPTTRFFVNRSKPPANRDTFAQQAEESAPGLVRELWDFLRTGKKWWLLPIVVTLLFATGFVLLTSSTAAPVIYMLF